MTSGWVKDGAVSDQIQDSIDDSVSYIRGRNSKPVVIQEELECDDCGMSIPVARQKLVKTRLCVSCQSRSEKSTRNKMSMYNRRGSMDSQLK